MTTPAHDGSAAAPATVPENTRETHHIARLALAAFVFTFVIARILVIFIMEGKLPPGLFFHVKGTHVHHLNYGIFLLSLTGGYLLFARPRGRRLDIAAILYGIGLGLTFDEFGMWLHLGGLYWQRASYDAVIVVASLLGLIAYGSTIRRWRPRHFITAVALAIVLAVFGFAMNRSMKWASRTIGPKLYHLEVNGPA